jgi:signal transduction histidine kinase
MRGAPQTLRWQLIRPFVALTAVAIVAASLSVEGLLVRAVWSPVDSAFREEAETLVLFEKTGGPSALREAVANVAGEHEWRMTGKFIRVWSADGNLIAHAGTAPAGVDAAPSTDEPRLLLDDAADPYRVVPYSAASGERMEIGARVRHQVRVLSRVRIGIAAGAAAMLVGISLLGWKTTSKATAELERLAAELETLEAASLDRRLPTQRTAEVDRLASVLNRLLARLDKAMAHLRRFTADAAHELRTPIAALRAHLEVAIARGGTTHDGQNGLLDALEQTERLGRLAEELLTLSVVESGASAYDRTPTVDLAAIAGEVAEFLEPIAQEQERTFQCLTDASVKVRGSSELLKRLVLNLVDNAFRHTPPKTRVRLTVRSVNGSAMVEVADQGPGISPADLPLVFERFHRGRGSAGGTGLGLALSREIVALHEGEIRLESAVGAGTIVTVMLPRVERPAAV